MKNNICMGWCCIIFFWGCGFFLICVGYSDCLYDCCVCNVIEVIMWYGVLNSDVCWSIDKFCEFSKEDCDVIVKFIDVI